MPEVTTIGFGGALLDEIERLGTVAGEIDNVMEGAIRDIAESSVDDIKLLWPQGERKYPSQKGPHSKGLWASVQREKLIFSIVNTADYASYVHNHPNQDGPPGLAERDLPGIIEENTGPDMVALSDAISALIEGD